MSEKVEWRVGYYDDERKFRAGADGAATVFGKTRAQQLARKLGPHYRLFHWQTMLEPDEYPEERNP